MAKRSGPWFETSKSKRQVGTKPERKKYLIVTEGHTEHAYLSHFKTSTKLEVIVENPRTTKQLSLVKRAKDILDERITKRKFVSDLDECWVVFDRDYDPTNPKDLGNFNAAISFAKRNDINVALSNDSFELWYLLHYQDVSTALHRRDIDVKLSQYLGRSYKSRHQSTIEDLYYDIKSKRGDAITRARRLHDACLGDGRLWHSENPLSLVYILIERIMSEEGFREE